ncbi:MAG: lipid-A-disaccharide synthase [Myxococcota bacterium]
MSTVLMSVGDASGDVYASDFVRELRRLAPETRFVGLGGVEMEKAGVELVVHQRDVAVSGLFELLPDLHRIVSAWRKMNAALRETSPDLVVLVDSSGFNIPFARRARRRGCPTLYYVSPQVWAWRTGRIRKLARWVNQLAVIFPFELDVYAGTAVPVEYVGHPLVERLRDVSASLDRAAARQRLGLPEDARVVALLPGSRGSEMRRLLPLHLEIARVLHARDPRIRFVMPRAASIDEATLTEGIAEAQLPQLLELQIVDGDSHAVFRAADVALLKPGTSTLEATLLDCPIVVAARTNPLTAWLARRLVQVDTLTMPNLIAREAIVPEFLQEEAEPAVVADAVLALLEPEAGEAQRSRLAVVRETLAQGGAAGRAAELAREMLGGRLPA